MKVIIILSGLFVLFTGFQLYLAVSINKTEQQKFELIKKEGELEIRFYPEAIMATTYTTGKYRSTSRGGFQTLAGYIFGSNDESKKIAMTAPVHMNFGDSASMSFVMPSEYEMDELPTPVDKNVHLHKSQARYVACIEFGGYADDNSIEKKSKELLKALKDQGLDHTGEIEYLGYNPPYQTVGRRNEVMVELINYKR